METLSRKQQSKYNRLVKDLETFVRSAQKTGKTLETYLTDLNLEPEIAAKLAIKAEKIKEVVEKHKISPEPSSGIPELYSENQEGNLGSKIEVKMQDVIKQWMADILKWAIIIIFVSYAFYLLYPKYYFTGPNNNILYRCNSINGQVEQWNRTTEDWTVLE